MIPVDESEITIPMYRPNGGNAHVKDEYIRNIQSDGQFGREIDIEEQNLFNVKRPKQKFKLKVEEYGNTYQEHFKVVFNSVATLDIDKYISDNREEIARALEDMNGKVDVVVQSYGGFLTDDIELNRLVSNYISSAINELFNKYKKEIIRDFEFDGNSKKISIKKYMSVDSIQYTVNYNLSISVYL
jgi:hypothetical protein